MHTFFRLALVVLVTTVLVSSFAATSKPAYTPGPSFIEGASIGENWETPL